MNHRIKKLAYALAFVVFLWAGMYVALIADVTEDSPYEQGALAISAAVLICIAILFCGYSNSIPWNKKDEK